MVLRKMWVLGNFGSDIGSVFYGSRSLVFFLNFYFSEPQIVFADGSRCLGFVILSFRLVLRSQFFRVHGYSLWNRTCRL